MIFLKFIFWVVMFFVVVNWFFRTFSKHLIGAFMRMLVNRAQDDLKRQSQEYQRNYEAGDFRKSVYQDDNLHVTAPKKENAAKNTKIDDFAEDVEFEEL